MVEMRRLAVMAACALALTGCGTSDEPPEKQADAEPESFSAIREWEANLESQGGFLMRDLGKIAPALDDEASLDDIENTCLDLHNGEGKKILRSHAQARFGDRAGRTLKPAELDRIVALARKYACPDA